MITFSKLSGSGNDFIIFDNRTGELNDFTNKEFVRKVASRGMSIGADGVIFIEKSTIADFKWRFFNSDGSIPEMCGNGSRCVARYAYINKIASKSMQFETIAGLISAEIKNGTDVKVELTKPHSLNLDTSIRVDDIDFTVSTINTGVPHAVIFTDDILSIDVKYLGRSLRYDSRFSPDGTNVNFAQITSANNLSIRTYERGVEDETLACGTGATAVALIAIEKGLVSSPVALLTKSGTVLKIYKEVDKVYLEGEARLVYIGELNIEGYRY